MCGNEDWSQCAVLHATPLHPDHLIDHLQHMVLVACIVCCLCEGIVAPQGASSSLTPNLGLLKCLQSSEIAFSVASPSENFS